MFVLYIAKLILRVVDAKDLRFVMFSIKQALIIVGHAVIGVRTPTTKLNILNPNSPPQTLILFGEKPCFLIDITAQKMKPIRY